VPIEQQPPDVLALILADAVLRDFATGKCFIQGTYSVITAPVFPHVHPLIVAYAAITNGHGQTEMRLRLVDVDEDRAAVFEAEAPVEFPDPIAVVEMVFTATNVSFPKPGEYRLQLYGAGQPLRERRLHVLAAGPAPRKG
jgi:hypothetical protein